MIYLAIYADRAKIFAFGIQMLEAEILALDIQESKIVKPENTQCPGTIGQSKIPMSYIRRSANTDKGRSRNDLD